MTQLIEKTFAPIDGAVTVDDVVTTRFGEKAILGGDTYGILSSKGEHLSAELDWTETHCTFDRQIGEWTIDEENLDDLEEVLTEHGHTLAKNWVDDMIRFALDHVKDDENKWDMWESRNVHVEVVYEAKKSKKEMAKEGIVTAADDGAMYFRRDDGRTNRIEADGIYSSGHYPFMGKIVEVRMTIPGDEIVSDPDELARMEIEAEREMEEAAHSG